MKTKTLELLKQAASEFAQGDAEMRMATNK